MWVGTDGVRYLLWHVWKERSHAHHIVLTYLAGGGVHEGRGHRLQEVAGVVLRLQRAGRHGGQGLKCMEEGELEGDVMDDQRTTHPPTRPPTHPRTSWSSPSKPPSIRPSHACCTSAQRFLSRSCSCGTAASRSCATRRICQSRVMGGQGVILMTRSTDNESPD